MIDLGEKINCIAFDHYKQDGEKLEKELKNPLKICNKIHKVAIILTIKGHLSRIGDLGYPKLNEQVRVELEKNIKVREMAIRTELKVTIDFMDDHLVRPSRAQNMIQAFMANLKRGMKTLSQNSASNPGGYRWPPTFSKWLKIVFWQFL
jgi:hypothetical protein